MFGEKNHMLFFDDSDNLQNRKRLNTSNLNSQHTKMTTHIEEELEDLTLDDINEMIGETPTEEDS